MAGDLPSGAFDLSLDEDVVDFIVNPAALDRIPAELLARIDEAREAIRAGALEVPRLRFLEEESGGPEAHGPGGRRDAVGEQALGPVEALADASLCAYPGEVHALLGENGAGKTTLMRVLCGALRPDRGEALVDGRRLRPGEPRAAAAAGIGMVHQHFTLVPSLTVAENVALGTREGSGLRLALDRVHARLAELERVTGLPVEAGAPVAGLSVGAKQRVEILKALYRDPRVLVLDEPTAVLGPQEVDWLSASCARWWRRGGPFC